MKKLSRITAVLISLTLFCSSLTVSAQNSDGWEEIPASDAYADYIKNPEQYKIIPDYYNASDVDGQIRESDVPKASVSEDLVLPEKYDVRDEGISPLIKDQSSDSTCAIFTVTGNYEIFAAKNNDERYFSEFHAKHALAQNYSDGINYFGFNRNPTGTIRMRNVSSYYMNGRGPVPLSVAEYQAGPALVPSSYVNHFKPEIQTQEIQVFPGIGTDITQAERIKWLTELKTLIYKYGSVAITITSDKYLSDTTNTYFYCPEIPAYHDHAVVCVGWDDTIPAEKFTNYYNQTPSMDGGLIFKNSWDEDWGDNGYGYISYANADLAMQDFQLVSAYRERAEDEKVQTYTELGSNSVIGKTSSQCKWFGNKFYLDKGEYVNLKEVSFYAPISDIKYDIYVSPSGEVDRDKFVYVDSVTPEYPGYYSVSTDFNLGSDDISEYFVVVKANCGSAFYAIPTEGSSADFVNLRTKYISYTESDKLTISPYSDEIAAELEEKGIQWSEIDTAFVAADNEDFSEYTTSNVCINAITVPFTPQLNMSLDVSTLNAVQSDEISVTAAVGGDGSGNYSYSHKLYFNDICIDEIVSTNNNYKFVPAQPGEYYVEVTVTDAEYNISTTVKTPVITVGNGEFAVDINITANQDGTYTVHGDTSFPVQGITYSTYIVKGSAILHKSVYEPTADVTFKADTQGTYTVIVYAQTPDGIRTSKSEQITI